VICEYLDEALLGPALMPGTPADRARAREWMKRADEDLHPACTALTIGGVPDPQAREAAGVSEYMALAGPAGRVRLARRLGWAETGPALRETADVIAVYGEVLDRMETVLARRDHLACEELSLADVAVVPFIYRLDCLGLSAAWEGGRRPAVAGWLARMTARPSFDPAVAAWIGERAAEKMKATGAAAREAVLPLLAG